MLEAGVEVSFFAQGDNDREVGGVDVGIDSEESTENVVDHGFEMRRELDTFFSVERKIKGRINEIDGHGVVWFLWVHFDSLSRSSF